MTISVSFKTLTGSNFTLDLDENLTMAEVKAKVAEGRGDEYSVELQKLIYNGKVLEDNTKVSEVGFEPTKFVVVMITRRKVEKPISDSATAGSATISSSSAPAPVVESTPAPVQAPPAVAEVPNFTSEQEQSIEAIAGMGYPRDQVIAALRAAYWNADRAVEFLLSGIPDNVIDDDAPVPAGGVDVGEEGSGLEDLASLRDLPQLNEIRALVQENPEMLAAILQQLAANNPNLVQAIQSNQQAFIDLLNAPPTESNERLQGAGGGVGGPRPAGGDQERLVIHLSQSEMEAINRIKSMGFQVPEAAIVEAFIACEKNEEATINFILSSMDD